MARSHPGLYIHYSEVRNEGQYNCFLGLIRVDFELFRILVVRIPWDLVLKGKETQDGWIIFKKEMLKAQEQVVSACHEVSQWGRPIVWLKSELLLRLQERKLPSLEEGSDKLRRVQGCG